MNENHTTACVALSRVVRCACLHRCNIAERRDWRPQRHANCGEQKVDPGWTSGTGEIRWKGYRRCLQLNHRGCQWRWGGNTVFLQSRICFECSHKPGTIWTWCHCIFSGKAPVVHTYNWLGTIKCLVCAVSGCIYAWILSILPQISSVFSQPWSKRRHLWVTVRDQETQTGLRSLATLTTIRWACRQPAQRRTNAGLNLSANVCGIPNAIPQFPCHTNNYLVHFLYINFI